MVREYIGARYVPKFMGSHDATQSYEALCVVDNGSGTSYISKIPTPAGTPLTDSTYWAIYGTTNGAIIHLQDEINEINERYDFIRPEDYGAVGDGVADDSDALIACFNDVTTKKSIFLKGTYKLTKQIVVKPNTHVFGFGVGKIIDNYDITGIAVMNDRATFLIDNIKNVVVDGVAFQGSGALSAYVPKYLFLMQTAENCTFKNCSFTDYPGVGVIYARGSNYVTVSHCYVKDYTRGAIEFTEGTSHSIIEYCSVIDGHETNTGNRYPIMLCGYDQVYDANNRAPQGEYIWCNGNFVYDTDPWWEGIDAHGGYNLFVTNNVVLNVASGISIFTNIDRGFSADTVYVTNNDVYDTTTATSNPANKYGNAFGGSRFRISNNRFRNGGKAYPDPLSANIFFDRGYSFSFDHNIVDGSYNRSLFFSGLFNVCLFTDNEIDAPTGGHAIVFNNGSAYSYGRMQFNENIFDGSGVTCAAPNSVTVSYQHIKFARNYSVLPLTFENIAQIQCDKLTAAQIADTSVGQNGDICINANPAVGSPIGWIMTNSSQFHGTWVALPNLA